MLNLLCCETIKATGIPAVEPPSQQNRVNVHPQQDPSCFKCKSNFTSLKYNFFLGYGNAPNGYGSKQKGTPVGFLKNILDSKYCFILMTPQRILSFLLY